MIKRSKVLAEPTSEPVSLQEAKEKLYLTDTDRDTTVQRLIKVARMQCEKDAGLSFITQTRVLNLDAFPSDNSAVQIPFGPVISMSGTDSSNNNLGISYVDDDGGTQTLTLNTDYYLDSHSAIPRLSPVDTWPTDVDDRIHAITITYTAGFGAASSVPMEAKEAILFQVASMHENPDGSQEGICPAAQSCLDSIRVYWNAWED